MVFAEVTGRRFAMRDLLDNELLSGEFQYQLDRNRAAELPDLIREFAEDLISPDTTRMARILADGAEEHIGALLERLAYKERVAEQSEAMIEAAQRLALGEVMQAGLDDCFDPRGSFVYILWAESEPVYIGMSSNVLPRLGAHMSDPERRAATARVQLLRCRDREHALEVEKVLIRQHEPRFNVLLY